MGGGRKYHYPKWVWSPAGGWWAAPASWKRNTAIYAVAVAGICFCAVSFAEPKTVSADL